MSNPCQVRWLGQVEFGQTLPIQKELTAKRLADEIPDTVLLLEHPRTYTIGVDGYQAHLLIDEQEMTRRKIAFYRVDRDGGIFFHCPGQLVVYPILKLGRNCYNYHDYLRLLESVIIRTLACFGVRAFRQQGKSGICVFSGNPASHNSSQFESSMAKISGIGVRVNRHGITSHGFWININPDLQYFDLIVPGGVKDGLVTSLQHVLNKSIRFGTVIEPVIQSFCEVFEKEPCFLENLVTKN